MTAAGPGDPVLAVDSIDTYYGGSHVLFDASLRVDGEEAVAVVGRNGAGKTTLMRSIVGLTPPRSGSIALHGEEIAGLAPERIAGRGVGYVPQDRRLFPDLSVRENLVMGLGRAPLDPGRMSSVLDRFPALRGRLDQRAGTLSGGERQMAAIARALIGEPDLLLLDEPTEGLMPALIPEVEGIVDDLAGAGYSILLVEQRVDLALSLADRVYAMEGGRIVDEVRPGDPDADGSRLEQYLGV